MEATLTNGGKMLDSFLAVKNFDPPAVIVNLNASAHVFWRDRIICTFNLNIAIPGTDLAVTYFKEVKGSCRKRF